MMLTYKKIYNMQTFQMNTFIALIYTKYRRPSLIAYVELS